MSKDDFAFPHNFDIPFFYNLGAIQGVPYVLEKVVETPFLNILPLLA